MKIFGQENNRSQQQELINQQSKQQSHQAMQQMGMRQGLQNQPVLNGEGRLKEQYLKQLVGSGLDQSSANLLKEMLTRDMVLSNLESAEVNEIRWLTRLLKAKLYALHPPEGSVIQGDYRAFLSDDPNDRLTPLNDKQRLLIDQAVKVVIARVTRSRGGWQQEEMSKIYTVSEARQDKDDSKKRGIFG